HPAHSPCRPVCGGPDGGLSNGAIERAGIRGESPALGLSFVSAQRLATLGRGVAAKYSHRRAAARPSGGDPRARGRPVEGEARRPDQTPRAGRAALKWHATTILSVRRGGKVAIGGDGQVTLGTQVMKADAVKIRKLLDGRVIV